eukprot:gene14205-17989_t
MLWSAATEKGYANPHWLTFKQAIELGGSVRKGEKGELVVYANRLTRTETDDKGEAIEREIPFMKGYTVFNAAYNRSGVVERLTRHTEWTEDRVLRSSNPDIGKASPFGASSIGG